MSIFNPNKELNEKIDSFISDLEIVISGMHNEIQTSKNELIQYFSHIKKVTEKYSSDSNIKKIENILNNYDELSNKINLISEKININKSEISLLSAKQKEQNSLFLTKFEKIHSQISENGNVLKVEIENIKYQNEKLKRKFRIQNILFFTLFIILTITIIYYKK
jgi:hypothetical protein